MVTKHRKKKPVSTSPDLSGLTERFSLDHYKTLVLNADYSLLRAMPISVISWTDAIQGIVKNRYQPLASYEGVVIRSQKLTIPLPSVVRMLEYQRVEHQISFSPQHVYLRDDYHCQYCDKKFPAMELTYDHVVPRAAGGKTDWNNIVAACHRCNADKGRKLFPEYRTKMGLNRPKVLPRKPTYWQLAEKIKKTRLIIPDDSGWLDYLDWEGPVYARSKATGALLQLQGANDPITTPEMMGF